MAANPTNVTLRMIARSASSSVSTVSYALRNDPRLRPATRERIQSIARKLGYRPNPIFSAMMVRARGSKRTVSTSGNVIAYVSGFSNEAGWRRSFPQADFFAGAKARAAAMNFHLELCFYLERGWSGSRLEQILRARGVRGMIVAPFSHDVSGDPLTLDWSHFALATIGFTLHEPMLHRVTADHYYNLRAALSAISGAGYRRIGCILPHAVSTRIDHQWKAALDSGPFGSSELLPPLMVDSYSHFDGTLVPWYRQHRPDVILTRSSEPSAIVRDLLGTRCPTLVDLCLGPQSQASGGIDEYSQRIGASAIDLVVSQLQHSEFGVPSNPTLTLIPGKWTWINPPAATPRPRRATRSPQRPSAG